MSEDTGSEVVRLEQRTPFTMVDNPIIRSLDDYVALGLYVDMLSRPPGWRINLREIAKHHKQGRSVLSGAMNTLIERGLVFRVRYQHSTGLWATRTYVCTSPVTFDELQAVHQRYRGRCRIETSTEHSHINDSPKARFRASGEQDSGEQAPGTPAVGTPGSGDPAPNPQESTLEIPPPDPAEHTHDAPPPPPPRRGRGKPTPPKPTTALPDLDTVSPDVAEVLAALQRAWPSLGRRTLSELVPSLTDACAEVGSRRLIAHLTENTAGVRHPSGVVRARLQDLPAPRTDPTPLPWCGRCASPEYRWIETNPPHPCPECSPQARVRAHLRKAQAP